MRILILGFTKKKYMPYLNFYLENINKENEVFLVYWNRDGKDDIDISSSIVEYEFSYMQEDEINYIKKIKGFLNYRNFSRKILSRDDYDLVIVLHTIPMFLLSLELMFKYKRKYIFDYRDVTFENLWFFKKNVEMLVKKSKATFISSEGFKKYLPDSEKIYLTHNIGDNKIGKQKTKENLNKNQADLENRDAIKIGFWGFIRHEKINSEMIKRLGNDPRFEIHYHGREQQTAKNLKKYCSINSIENVFFHGEYNPGERSAFVLDTDIIHNVYDNDFKTKQAMGNKFYDALFSFLPQICNKGSYMGTEVEKSGIGVALDPYDTNFANELYEYYKSIDWIKFNNSIVEKQKIVEEDYSNASKKVMELTNDF